MATVGLREFVEQLDSAGQLVRVTAEVDAVLEIAEIARRQMKLDSPEGLAGAPKTDPVNGRFGGRAMLFTNVRGSEFPVLINAFGSYARMYQALGCESFTALAERIGALLKPEIPATLLGKLKMLPELAKLGSFIPRVSKGAAPCQEVVHTGERADLTALPVIQCWPGDGAGHPAGPVAGRYVTLGAVVTADPETGRRNMGIYRVQLFGPRRAGMHIHPHHDGARHWRAYKRLGQPMPAAIVLGGEPVLPFAASAPLPPGTDEMLLAGFLQRRRIHLTSCQTQPLAVPANAEIVIEGTVSATETCIEGPFGDHTGFYSLPEAFPVFDVTAITHRRGAIYPTTTVGAPPMEDYYLGKATERLFLPMLQTLVPDIVDYDLPMFGAFHNFAFVQIRKETPYQARRVMHAIWGAGQMSLTKFIIVVDESVNVHDPNDVLFHVGANVDPSRDLELVHGPLDILDHAAVEMGAGGKIGIDATRKIAGEGRVRDWPGTTEMSREIIDRVNRRWGEYGFS